jgi:hypothetical protein
MNGSSAHLSPVGFREHDQFERSLQLRKSFTVVGVNDDDDFEFRIVETEK